MKEQVCGVGSSSGLIARDKYIHIGKEEKNNPDKISFV